MTTFHLAGFPRVGAKRELKFAQERYWRGEIAEADLLDIAKKLREINWQHQANANADFVAVADFTFYDHILDLQVATGVIPARFGFDSQNLTLDQYFQLARGNKTQFAIEMTKWFDTNYHYLVPEFHKDTQFKANPVHYVHQLRIEFIGFSPVLFGQPALPLGFIGAVLLSLEQFFQLARGNKD